ncbi:MAG: hypothetical protein NTY38_28505 [Acidobacteria bacterium]|nr:hypothetical protein [Acidobacteriota bacterium]
MTTAKTPASHQQATEDVQDMLLYRLAHNFANGVCTKCGQALTEENEGQLCGRGALSNIARFCGVSVTAVKHWLDGRSMPNPVNVRRLREYFDKVVPMID